MTIKISELTPDDVKAMPLDEFTERFGFRPVDALEKWGWAMQAGVLDMPDLAGVRMN